MNTTITKRSAALAPAIPPTTLGVRLPLGVELLGCETLAEASAIFLRAQRALAERTGWTQILSSADVFDCRSGTPVRVATISQNGNVWSLAKWKPGMVPLHAATGGAL